MHGLACSLYVCTTCTQLSTCASNGLPICWLLHYRALTRPLEPFFDWAAHISLQAIVEYYYLYISSLLPNRCSHKQIKIKSNLFSSKRWHEFISPNTWLSLHLVQYHIHTCKPVFFYMICPAHCRVVISLFLFSPTWLLNALVFITRSFIYLRSIQKCWCKVCFNNGLCNILYRTDRVLAWLQQNWWQKGPWHCCRARVQHEGWEEMRWSMTGDWWGAVLPPTCASHHRGFFRKVTIFFI